MPMRCPRCEGFMIPIQMKGLWGSDMVDAALPYLRWKY
jgi:hypothetical protein